MNNRKKEELKNFFDECESNNYLETLEKMLVDLRQIREDMSSGKLEMPEGMTLKQYDKTIKMYERTLKTLYKLKAINDANQVEND